MQLNRISCCWFLEQIITSHIICSLLELINLNYAAFIADNRDSRLKQTWPFIRSQRGAPLLVHTGFVYRHERKINDRTYWLCIRYKGLNCNSRIILNGNQLRKATEHNHNRDDRSSENSLEYKDLEDSDIDEWIKGSSKTKHEK